MLRVVTLAPHLAEMMFAVGAGDNLVGVSAYTDYPQAAAELPVVGDAFNVDHERLVLLDPGLLLVWDTGTPSHVIDELRSRGYRVGVIRTTGLADISDALLAIGNLTGHEKQASQVVREFETGLAELERKYGQGEDLRVFYQLDARPLYTINGNHFLSDLVTLCGGTNIFDDLDGLAPMISTEAVLERDPEVLLASMDAGPDAFDGWDRWTELSANRYGNRFRMPAAETGRATPRLLIGAKAVCEALESARQNREAFRSD
jgi:iron complex transport system substrate-binding protein